MVMQGLGSLLWLGFDPWPGNFHMPWGGGWGHGQNQKTGHFYEALTTCMVPCPAFHLGNCME